LRHYVYIDIVSGTEFRRIRVRIGLSQAKLAAKMDVTVRTISRWETDDVAIPRLAELALRFIERESKGKGGR
jgi:DNA-binding transcriptional regulator YiaG